MVLVENYFLMMLLLNKIQKIEFKSLEDCQTYSYNAEINYKNGNFKVLLPPGQYKAILTMNDFVSNPQIINASEGSEKNHRLMFFKYFLN